MERDFNLEHDLQRSSAIVEKVKNYEYAQALYAAICNNTCFPKDVMELLKNEGYSISWRYAGGMVARLRGFGDYMDFYCSGSFDDINVPEGFVRDEIREDLSAIGWVLK